MVWANRCTRKKKKTTYEVIGTWNGFEIDFWSFIHFLQIPSSILDVPDTSFAIYKTNGVFTPILTNLGIKQSFRRLIGKDGYELLRFNEERLAFDTRTEIYDSE